MERDKLIAAIKVAREQEKRDAANNYYSYVRYTNVMATEVKHQKFICDIIDEAIKTKQKMLAGEIPMECQYLMFNLPPRHGKSMTITETIGSYYLGKFKDHSVIIAAYNDDFATKFGRRNKEKIEEFGTELFDIGVSKASSSASDLEIEGRRGRMICRGILGGITGEGADLCIIDDPVRNREAANSPTIREKIWDEWNDSIHSRRHPAAIFILIMTRWHEADLAGMLLSEEFGEVLPWRIINLPLIAEENDLMGREIGEVLWEGRLSENSIRQLQSIPQTFNSLYQGRPTSREGNMFKRDNWKFYKKRDEFIRTLPIVVMSVDGALTDTNDRCSIQIWGKKGANYYAIDNITDRMNFMTTLQTIRLLLKKYPMINAKYIENRASGAPLINVLNTEIGGFLPIQASSSTGGKEQRANAISPYQESGNIFLPEGEPWVSDFIEETASFPNGKYKDQVDAFSQIINKLSTAKAENEAKPYNMFEEFYGKRNKVPDYDEFDGTDETFNTFGCGGI